MKGVSGKHMLPVRPRFKSSGEITFCTVSTNDFTVEQLDKRATEMAERLYPAVTTENVHDYLNRAF